MDEPSPSSSCSSTAVAASPSRILRGGRQGSENLAALLSPSTPASPSQGQPRGPSRSRWLLLQSCFVVLVLGSVVLFSMDAQRVAWISKLLHRTGPAAPAPAFQVGRLFHACFVCRLSCSMSTARLYLWDTMACNVLQAGQPVHSRKAAAGARTADQDKADAAAFVKVGSQCTYLQLSSPEVSVVRQQTLLTMQCCGLWGSTREMCPAGACGLSCVLCWSIVPEEQGCAQGAHELDWKPEEYSARVGGGIPKVLHHIFLDGEEEYSKWVAPMHSNFQTVSCVPCHVCTTGAHHLQARCSLHVVGSWLGDAQACSLAPCLASLVQLRVGYSTHCPEQAHIVRRKSRHRSLKTAHHSATHRGRG